MSGPHLQTGCHPCALDTPNATRDQASSEGAACLTWRHWRRNYFGRGSDVLVHPGGRYERCCSPWPVSWATRRMCSNHLQSARQSPRNRPSPAFSQTTQRPALAHDTMLHPAIQSVPPAVPHMPRNLFHPPPGIVAIALSPVVHVEIGPPMPSIPCADYSVPLMSAGGLPIPTASQLGMPPMSATMGVLTVGFAPPDPCRPRTPSAMSGPITQG
jgi:hypothetical protein